MAAFWNWIGFSMTKVQTFQLAHGYSLTVYQDWDVGGHELDYSLRGPWVYAEKTFFGEVSGEKRVPHFTAHLTTDGGLEWVTADTHPDQVLFMIDLSSAEYWPRWEKNVGWPQAKSYLDRINTDGEQRMYWDHGRNLDEAWDCP
jgi:hypothetical protein